MVLGLFITGACSATARGLRQVATHQKRVQLFPAGLLVIAFAPADNTQIRPVRTAAGPADYFPRPRGTRYARRGRPDGRDASATDCGTGRGRDGSQQPRSTVFRPRPPRCATPQSRRSCARVSDGEPACCARTACSRIRLRPSRDETMRRESARAWARRARSRAQPAAASPPHNSVSHAIMTRTAAVPCAAGPLQVWRRARAGNRAAPARFPD